MDWICIIKQYERGQGNFRFVCLYFITTRGSGKKTKFGRYYIQISEIDRIEVMELISLKRKLYKRTGIEENTRVTARNEKKKIIPQKNKQTVGIVWESSKCLALFADALLPSLDKKERGDSPEPVESRRILSHIFFIFFCKNLTLINLPKKTNNCITFDPRADTQVSGGFRSKKEKNFII